MESRRWRIRLIRDGMTALCMRPYNLKGLSSTTDLLSADDVKPQGFFVTLTVEDPARARHIFAQLAERGTIGLPFQATFWSPGFGVVVDEFGMPWEINSVEPAASA